VPEEGGLPHLGGEISGINLTNPDWANFFYDGTKLTSQANALHPLMKTEKVHHEYIVAIER
jgi:hypothetical protein